MKSYRAHNRSVHVYVLIKFLELPGIKVDIDPLIVMIAPTFKFNCNPFFNGTLKFYGISKSLS